MWTFIGPPPLAGIGQVMLKYAKLANGEYLTFDDPIRESYGKVLCFLLPIEDFIIKANIYKERSGSFFAMTVCETDPVSPGYEYILKNYKCLVPSEFCRGIFQKQFGIDTSILRHYTPPVPIVPVDRSEYVFYSIGNLIDPRKNVKMMLEAFIRCDFGVNAKLLLKSTGNRPLNIKLKNVEVIDNLISEEDLETLFHRNSHCYINCSFSEGVGMGAVEAAIRGKAIICTDFGGLQEYVDTPFILKTKRAPIGNHAEFLYSREMEWGIPNIDDLISCMKFCYHHRVSGNPTKTREIMNKIQDFFP